MSEHSQAARSATDEGGRRLLQADLDHVLAHTAPLWEGLRGKRIFITGGTGFFGIWLVESFLYANDCQGLQAQATVLSRDPDSFLRKAPHLAGKAGLDFLRGDMSSFAFPEGEFSYVIHAATEPVVNLQTQDSLDLFQRNIQGTHRVLEFARCAAVSRFLLTSSGAVYGPLPPDVTHTPEDYSGAPASTDLGSAYGHSKRVSEFLCAAYAQHYGFTTSIARCFAFVGPHLPLDANYAVGNFMRDALAGRPIRINGDGTPRRSYLYAADLAVWLWTILFRGTSCRAYNVGSEADLSIAELAHVVAAEVNPALRVEIAGAAPSRQPTHCYVPTTRRAREELGLEVRIPLREAIRRMASWYVQQH